MLLGTAGIAALALLASLMLVWGALAVSKRIDDASGAEVRIELLSTLSARINDYAVIAIELANSAAANAQSNARLTSARGLVEGEFRKLHKAIADDVERATSEIESNRRATKGLGAERMRARFEALANRLAEDGVLADQGSLRAELDGFATQFSPELDQMLGQERRIRNAAFASIADLRKWLLWIAAGIAALALGAVPLFQLGLVSPLIRRIEQAISASKQIGAGRFETRLGVDRHDEFGLLFANVNRMAAKLNRRASAIDSDRARLNEIVEDRTEALRSANEELTRIDENRRRFFSDVSHELRTPLTVILSESDLAMRSDDLSDESRAGFDVIQARARRLNRRIDDLLRIARSEAGAFELEMLPFDVVDAAQQAIEDADGLARRRGVGIKLEHQGDLQSLGDADWIRQIFVGLLENALRHSSRGGRISLRLSGDQMSVTAHIIDEGTGVAVEDQERVFERFERGTHQQGLGFGVGLALARWLIDRHSGTIALDSPANEALSVPKKGPGTTVTVVLPRLLDESDDG